MALRHSLSIGSAFQKFGQAARNSVPSSSHFRHRPWQPILQTRSYLRTPTEAKVPSFAFAFDIDGVLLRSADPIPKAHETLAFLQSQQIPFILLTNGGGKHETERVSDLSAKLKVPLDTTNFIQSHTPFAEFHEFKDKTVLVVGGDEDKCRHVAESYGYKSVITPGDILIQYPNIWPFSHPFLEYYRSFARPLPRPIDPSNPSESLKVDAIFVYNDPRDWGLDATIIVDLLLSQSGIMGTVSPKNGRQDLPNKGYQQDGQPGLYYSNPDLWWAAKFHLPRLGQGAFRESLEGLWTAITGGTKNGVELDKIIMGKPYQPTYEFAEKKLLQYRKSLFDGSEQLPPLKNVYMIGDNPESDIRGGNSYQSSHGTNWRTFLVQTGVYQAGTTPAWKPTYIAEDVYSAVKRALQEEAWPSQF